MRTKRYRVQQLVGKLRETEKLQAQWMTYGNLSFGVIRPVAETQPPCERVGCQDSVLPAKSAD